MKPGEHHIHAHRRRHGNVCLSRSLQWISRTALSALLGPRFRGDDGHLSGIYTTLNSRLESQPLQHGAQALPGMSNGRTAPS